MLYNRCTGIYKFGNNTYPRRIRRRSNLGNIFRGGVGKCVLLARKYGICIRLYSVLTDGQNNALNKYSFNVQNFCVVS